MSQQNSSIATRDLNSGQVLSNGRTPDAFGRRRLQPVMIVVAILLAMALIAPIWLVEYVPLVDYPDHLARAFILSHLHDPSYKFADFYSSDWGPYPYVALDLSFIALMKLFPVEVAGKIVLSLILLVLPLCCAYFAHKIGGESFHAAIWAGIVSISGYFLLGFVTMHLSFALALLALGLWSDLDKSPGNILRWVGVFLAISASYFAHLLGFALAGIAVTLVCIFDRKSIRHLLMSWSLFVPAALCYVFSRATHPNGRSAVEWRSLADKVVGLASAIRGYSTPLDLITLLAALAILVVAVWRNREFRVNRPWASVAIGLFLLYWIFPATYTSGADADRRLLPFVVLIAVSTLHFGKRTKYFVFITTLLLAVRIANTQYNFKRLQSEQHMMARSFDSIPRDARVLPMVELMDRRHLLRTPHEFWSYGVIRKGWFSPYIFDDPGVHALRIKPTYAPKGFGAFHYRENIDWTRINSAYDYVWAYNVRSMNPELATVGTIVFREGLLDVYRMKHTVSAEAQP